MAGAHWHTGQQDIQSTRIQKTDYVYPDTQWLHMLYIQHSVTVCIKHASSGGEMVAYGKNQNEWIRMWHSRHDNTHDEYRAWGLHQHIYY